MAVYDNKVKQRHGSFNFKIIRTLLPQKAEKFKTCHCSALAMLGKSSVQTKYYTDEISNVAVTANTWICAMWEAER